MRKFISAVMLALTALMLAAQTPAGPSPVSSLASASIDGAWKTLPQHSAANLAAKAVVDPQQLYKDAWKVVDDNFLYRDRLKNWSQWETKYDGKLKTEADAEQAINEMLDSLGEDYTYYKTPAMVRAENQRSRQSSVVSYRMMPGNIAYIKIQTFGSLNTAAELRAALKALTKADGYIIDLRNNGGGYVDQAFRSFELFVDQGLFTKMKGHYNGKPYVETYSVETTELVDEDNAGNVSRSKRQGNLTGNKPITVLVNQDTASASEMLSGALRDHKRATIIGTKTFGKGIAQIAPELANKGAVRVTFAEYFFPGGDNIQGKGITPHQTVSSGGQATDRQLDAGVRQIEIELGR